MSSNNQKINTNESSESLSLKKILLMGNPNVGKSVFFTELTGIDAVSSNFSGTTVNYMEGAFRGDAAYKLVDTPGTYSLTPTSAAEQVTTELIKGGAAAIICVLDASNLERNLCLALEIQHYNIPVVYALNMTDVASRKGILINEKLLAQELGGQVISTVAVKKEGFDDVLHAIKKIIHAKHDSKHEHTSSNNNDDNKIEITPCGSNCPACSQNHSCDADCPVWIRANEIVARVTKKKLGKPSTLDRLGDSMMRPFPGLPIAALVLALTVGLVSFGGRGLRVPFRMLVDGAIVPFFRDLFGAIVPDGVFLNILVGEYGIFVISFQWIIALILPYVFTFYLAISFLEDSGYLPRVSVLFDNVMRKLGFQGGSLIHVFLALGCAVPAIIGGRTATTQKERLMIAVVVCFSIPCIAQTGALITLMSAFGIWWMLPLMFAIAFILFVMTALVANKIIKGKTEPLILEIPNLLLPKPKTYFRKLAIRMKHFMVDAEIPMLAAVVLAALLAETGVLNFVANYSQPVVSGWLGLPKDEATMSLILGIVRREMSVAPFIPLIELNAFTPLQAFVCGIVSLIYLPCISVFGILFKEFKIKISLIILTMTIVAAIFVGGVINHTVRFFM